MTLRICIHRGAAEIGGNCVELEADGHRLLLDLGRPLDADRDDLGPLPPVPGLDGAPAETPLLGVVISHGHADHYGLLAQVPPSVPVYLGRATARILGEAAFFGAGGLRRDPAGFLESGRPIAIGPFRVTPLLVDHSAFDAHALLVEAGGRRLLYTGDLRGHGRKARLFEELLACPPLDIDTLVMEGTQVRGTTDTADPEACTTEKQVEERCVGLFRETEGMVLVAYSGQNIDRLVSLYRAAKRAGRTFVLDLYGHAIAEATGRDSIPRGGFDGLRVFVPQSQRVRVKNARAFERTKAIEDCRIYQSELASASRRFVVTFRASMMRELARTGGLTGACLVWSQWRGYLEDAGGQRLQAWLDDHNIPLVHCHASGHATVRDLQRLAQAIAPRRLVPIHSAAGQRFDKLFSLVERHADGEWWEA